MDKKSLIAVIARDNAGYGAWIENCPGVYGEGNTVQEVKKELLEGLDLFIAYNKKENLPEILQGDYEIVYRFDVPSFLQYYSDIFTTSALERLTGVNKRQLQHYASGLHKPLPVQRKKIGRALHDFGKELQEVEL